MDICLTMNIGVIQMSKKKIIPFPIGSDHEWYDDIEEIEALSEWYSSGEVLWTFWGHHLFETEFLEIMTICMICGHGIHGCVCDE